MALATSSGRPPRRDRDLVLEGSHPVRLTTAGMYLGVDQSGPHRVDTDPLLGDLLGEAEGRGSMAPFDTA